MNAPRFEELFNTYNPKLFVQTSALQAACHSFRHGEREIIEEKRAQCSTQLMAAMQNQYTSLKNHTPERSATGLLMMTNPERVL